MTALNTEAYTARISNATPAQLCVITYEILLDRIDQALSLEPSRQDYKTTLDKSRQALSTLAESLDMSNPVAVQLFPLYTYADKLLIEAYFSADKTKLHEARKIIQPLAEAFRVVECADVPENLKKPMLNLGQQIYAGLTYKDGKLDEFVDQDINRGFKG